MLKTKTTLSDIDLQSEYLCAWIDGLNVYMSVYVFR